MNIVEIRVAGRYKLGSHIGTGAYSDVYRGKNVHSSEDVAIKLEDQKNRYPQVIYEGQLIQQLQGGKGIPGVFWCGHDGDYNILVMELLGDNLNRLLQMTGNKFSYKTVLMIADQVTLNLAVKNIQKRQSKY
jgi:serine/threonine protein kinase